MTWRIGVVSDTHLVRITKEFRDIFERYLSDKDLILHAGDVVCEEVLEFLAQGNLEAVHGNMDPVEVRERLPSRRIVQIGRIKIGLTHGWGSPKGLEERVRSGFDDVDVIVYGHSHRPANHVKEGTLLFNPGTATGFALSGGHTIGLLEIDDEIQGKIITL